MHNYLFRYVYNLDSYSLILFSLLYIRSRTGRKGPYACYYVHIEPGHCLVGGGLWQPEASALAKLRASVDERPHRIRRVLTDPEFVRNFLPNAVGKKEDKILKAFADKNQENALKTKPKVGSLSLCLSIYVHSSCRTFIIAMRRNLSNERD